MKLLITAGGQGTKLWPLSRQDKPKQFQNIIGEETLFGYNVKVLLTRHKPEDIFVSTKEKYVKFVREISPEILEENIIVEPDFAKNRGPGEGYAFLRLSLLHPNEPFMLIQSDDMRLPEERFLNMIEVAEELVRRDRKYITGGYMVEEPIVGNDYLKLGSKLASEFGIETYEVQEFVKRSDNMEQLKKIVSDSDICIHSNHGCWFPNLMLDAYKEYRPDWYEALMDMKQYIGQPNEREMINKIYEQMESGSTEEVTKHIFSAGYIILLPFEWVDIGTWSSLFKHYSKNGNVHTEGNVVSVDSTHSLVKTTNKDKLIATLGINNLVIVDTDDTLLVANLDKSGEIKKILNKMKETENERFL